MSDRVRDERQTRLMQLQLAQVNVVASDLAAVVEFLRRIGLDIADTLPAWMGHHRRIDSTGTGLVADLDSSAFAASGAGLRTGGRVSYSYCASTTAPPSTPPMSAPVPPEPCPCGRRTTRSGAPGLLSWKVPTGSSSVS